MTDIALSHALVPPLDHETKKLKDIYFLIYRTDPQLLAVFMLFYAITYVRRPQVISFDTMAVTLDSCTSRTVATPPPPPPQKKKKKSRNLS